jgi:peptide/nickel transport system permease protein
MTDLAELEGPAAVEAGVAAPTPSRGRLASRVRGDRAFAIALAVLAVYLVAALAAPLLAPADPNVQHLRGTLLSPGGGHLLGTDEYGRDELSRLLFALRASLGVGAAVALISGLGGLVLGLACGYLRGVVDVVISRIVDVGLAFPTLVLALALITALGVGVRSTVIALTLGFIPFYARMMRGSVLRLRQEGFVESARVTGVHPVRIVARHVLPNLVGPILVQVSMVFAYALLGEAGLSFIGLGVQAPTPSLGNMIASGQVHALDAPWLTVAPGLAAAIIIITLLFIGDALRDAADPLTVR